ncbi:MAG: hypothetical protein AB7E32_07050 [Desulfovibrio sp.]
MNLDAMPDSKIFFHSFKSVSKGCCPGSGRAFAEWVQEICLKPVLPLQGTHPLLRLYPFDIVAENIFSTPETNLAQSLLIEKHPSSFADTTSE